MTYFRQKLIKISKCDFQESIFSNFQVLTIYNWVKQRTIFICSTSAGLLVSSSAELRYKLLLTTEKNPCWGSADPQTWDASAAVTAVKQMPLLCHDYVKPMVQRLFENSD